jgi:hypothetical protein
MKGTTMHDPHDPHDPWSGYRPDMDQHRDADPVLPEGWWVPFVIMGGTTIIVLTALWIFT